ncbi:MAG TPA: hypothetical protein PK096_00070 [Candidatus Saccharibacteria bacterium]|nr:hypothetical protein [Candidatus Saccharibacteria bacterium]HRK93750.1 hypothetical protein [Candidatus Saccharibacteria bacterium]
MILSNENNPGTCHRASDCGSITLLTTANVSVSTAQPDENPAPLHFVMLQASILVVGYCRFADDASPAERQKPTPLRKQPVE